MPFRDYSTNPDANEQIGEALYIGPNMDRNNVRPALQQLAADGKELDGIVEVLASDGINTDPLLRADLAAASGAGLVGTAYFNRTVGDIVDGLNPRLRDPDFTISSIKAFGDSFAIQPNPHTSGDSLVKKYATLQGLASPTITATSGHTSADGQTGIFTASIAVTDHTIHLFGQNDAQFLGTSADSVKGPRIADVGRIVLANLVWLGKAAGTNKVAAAAASAGQLAVAGTWAADADLAGAFKASVAGAAMQATFTNCRYVVLLYKAKIGSTGRFYIKREDDDTDHPVFSAAPESGWVPTNTGQTWAVMARVYDLGSTLPTAKLQLVIDASTGGGDVSVVGFVGFSGDVETGPLLGVADVSRRGSAGYATASGSEANVPIVDRVIDRAVAAASAMGARVIDLPVASVIDASTGLAADAFHPSESGAASVAAAWKARVDSATPLAGRRLDLAVQGLIQNMGGEFAPGMALVLDEQARLRTKRLGARGMYFPSTDNIVRMSTSGVYLTPEATDFTLDIAKALLLLADGNHGYMQARTGDLVLGAAGSNRARIVGDALVPETDAVQALGSASKVWSAIWSYLYVHVPRTFAQLPTASAGLNGTRAYITDSTLAYNGTNLGAAAAGGGANHSPVTCLNGAWVIG